jgi:hypothetical protein
MKKILLITCLTLILIGCASKVTYKDIEQADIPKSCIDFNDAVCGLFDCMVDMCWCDESSPKSPIIYEKQNVVLNNEQDVEDYIEDYMDHGDPEYKKYSKITNIVKLNNIFYNVFAEDPQGEEIVFTVAIDGTIIITTCGV